MNLTTSQIIELIRMYDEAVATLNGTGDTTTICEAAHTIRECCEISHAEGFYSIAEARQWIRNLEEKLSC